MKKYILSLAIAALSIGIFAFATAGKNQSSPAQTQLWYDYDEGDPNLSSSYVPHEGPAPTCVEGTTRCAVKALPKVGAEHQPNMSDPNIVIRNFTP